MSNLAVREFNGQTELTGVYLLRDGDMEVAFSDEFAQIEAEDLVDVAEGPHGGLTWEQVLHQLVERQSVLVTQRQGPFRTDADSAEELLASSLKAEKDGLDPADWPDADRIEESAEAGQWGDAGA